MEPLLRIVQLRKSFGEHEVLAGIDLEVRRGETVSVIGPSGSGKTTLLRCVNYLEKPSAGEIRIDGKLIGVRPSNGVRSRPDKETLLRGSCRKRGWRCSRWRGPKRTRKSSAVSGATPACTS